MAGFSVEFSGLRRLKKKIKGYKKKMDSALKDEVDYTTKKIQNTARDNAPEVTGNLVDRYQHFISMNGKEGVVFNDAEYARRIELGFSGTDALGRHYEQKGQYPLTRAYKKEIKGFGKRLRRRL